MIRFFLFATVLVCGCGTGPLVIDARDDAGRPPADAGAPVDADSPSGMDAGMALDGGSSDAGPPDGGPCVDPEVPDWAPIDTGGPAGETLSQCLARAGTDPDPRLPADQAYLLSTFGSASDSRTTSCGDAASADGSWYYAANGHRFSCGTHIRLVDAARSRCVIVEVADVGPSACVEEGVAQPVWDVSPLAANHLFGTATVNVDDGRDVFGAPVDRDNPLGPCDPHLGRFGAGFIGSACGSGSDCSALSGGFCLSETQGFPGGSCTQDCTTSCPDLDGPYAYTACARATPGSSPQCFARCDFTLFASGCREGYACTERPAPGGSGNPRWVCLPSSCP